MKRKYHLLLFLLVLAGDLVAVYLEYKPAEYFFKPLIVVLLLFWLIAQTGNARSDLRKWIILALLFSWLGDVLLVLQGNEPLFFLAGLSAFLVAHIFYIVFFHFIRKRENIKGRWYLMLAVAVYYLLLISLLSPYLGDMRLPVGLYGLVISFMFLLAMHMLYGKSKTAGLYFLAGAVFFIISDSVLAINKFYRPFQTSGIIIMLTYGLAQLFLTTGAIRYVNSTHKG